MWVIDARDGDATGWWAALPLLLAGLGSGTVISPNVTITLSEVPVEQGGAASGVLQTVQRIGSAMGIAVVGTVLFTQVADSAAQGGRPDWTGSVVLALLVCVGLVSLALLVALADVVGSRVRSRAPQPETS